MSKEKRKVSQLYAGMVYSGRVTKSMKLQLVEQLARKMMLEHTSFTVSRDVEMGRKILTASIIVRKPE
jgi:hypothetical protein